MKRFIKLLLRITRSPPARWECRPPKAGEMVYDGVSKRVTTAPTDSPSDHWVCVPVSHGTLALKANWWLHAMLSRLDRVST